MVRLTDLPEDEARLLRDWDCPRFEDTPLVRGAPLARRRIALISTAGLRRPDDRPFGVDAADYRILPLTARDTLLQDHLSSSHDRTGFQQDLNTVLPLDRMLELRDEGVGGSLADVHYSFMGASDVSSFGAAVTDLAGVLHGDGVDTVLLCPV